MLLLTLTKTPHNRKDIRPISIGTILMCLTYKIPTLHTTENKMLDWWSFTNAAADPPSLAPEIVVRKEKTKPAWEVHFVLEVFWRVVSYRLWMLFLRRTNHKLQLFHTSNEPELPTVNKGELKNLLGGTITKLELEAKRDHTVSRYIKIGKNIRRTLIS